MSEEEKWLLRTLAAVLSEPESIGDDPWYMLELDWEHVLALAKAHAVVSFLDPLVENEKVAEPLLSGIRNASIQVVQQSYRLMFLTRYLVEQLEAEGVPVVVLKGVSAAAMYPVPELRKSGDVDLFLPNAQGVMERVAQVLNKAGFQQEEKQRVNHHHVWRSPQGIEIELHVMLAEPFDDKTVNEYLKDVSSQVTQHILRKDIMGISFPVLSEGYQAFQLLLHMLQHFLRSGFGLKLLCDWVVFWNRDLAESEIRQYRQLILESGLGGFSDMVTSISMKYLGLRECYGESIRIQADEKINYDSFLEDILEAAEFGESDETRMVVLRGTGIKDYVREFHHQMKLSYPRWSKYWILWPILWAKALYRFCRNNKQIRGVSMWQVLKKARERSRNMAKLCLFQKL